MVRCPGCGAENNEGAKFCDQCKTPLGAGEAQPVAGEAPQGPSFDKETETMGRRVERDFDKMGKDLARGAEIIGRDFTRWYDQRLGLVGPFVSALIGILILVLVLVILAVLSGNHPFWVHLRDFVILYLPLFIVLSVFDRYADFFRRKRNRRYRPFDPALTGVAIVAWFWIGIQFLLMLGDDMGWEGIENFASSLGNVFLVIAILVIAIGALLSVQRVLAPEMFMPPRARGPEPPR